MAGLDALPDASMVARVVAACGLEPRDLRIAGRGATAIGWRVDTEAGPVAARFQLPAAALAPGESARFEAQFALLETLHPLESRVPRPIATSADPDLVDPLGGRVPWALDGYIDAEAFDEAGYPEAAARDLGEVLARLHAMPVEGFGPLEDRRGALRGSHREMLPGLLGRWGTLWPFDGSALISHPIGRLAPQHLGALSRLREALLRYLEVPLVALTHVDLNGDNILVEDRRLVGLIDFGDASVLHPAWDFASFAHHNGWPLTEVLIESYEASSIMRELRLAEAYQLAVPLAVQKVLKWNTRDAQRVPRILGFLAETLPLAVRAAGVR